MPLIHLGVSHRAVRSTDLTTLGVRGSDLPARLVEESPVVRGAIALATCNRFELYLDAAEFHPAVEAARDLIGTLARPDLAGVEESLVIHAGDGAVEHLFEVASGLDSMVVGEQEIAGQVRQALAAHDRTAGPVLRRLFQAALTTSKAVASSTSLGSSGRSLASVGLDLVAERFGALQDRRVLLQGTGAYAGVVVAELLKRGVSQIQVHSGTGRAATFADGHPPVVPAADLTTALGWADVVVCCSGTGVPALTADLLSTARQGSPALLPVLALADDLAADVTLLPEVIVIDLEEVARYAPEAHASSVAQAGEIINRGVATFLHMEGGRQGDPAVIAIRAYVSGIIENEIDAANRRHTPETAEAIARSLRRVSNALLHTPSVRASELARTGGLDDYRNALHTLFGIDVEVGK